MLPPCRHGAAAVTPHQAARDAAGGTALRARREGGSVRAGGCAETERAPAATQARFDEAEQLYTAAMQLPDCNPQVRPDRFLATRVCASDAWAVLTRTAGRAGGARRSRRCA